MCLKKRLNFNKVRLVVKNVTAAIICCPLLALESNTLGLDLAGILEPSLSKDGSHPLEFASVLFVIICKIK